MKKVIVAGIAAVAIAGSTAAVYAQHRHHHAQRMSMEDRAAFVDARIAAVKAELQLTPDQEKNWAAVEAAVRDFTKQRIALANARATERDARRADRNDDRSAAPTPPVDPVTRLRDRADAMAETAAGLKRIADAADPLYKSLDDKQKRRLAVLTRMGARDGWRMQGFGRDFGRFERDRDRNPAGPGDRGQSERL